MEKKLIGYIKDFQWVDLLGFARLVGIDINDFGAESEDFEDFVTEVIVKFLEKPRKERRGLLELAKKISRNNRDFRN